MTPIDVTAESVTCGYSTMNAWLAQQVHPDCSQLAVPFPPPIVTDLHLQTSFALPPFQLQQQLCQIRSSSYPTMDVPIQMATLNDSSSSCNYPSVANLGVRRSHWADDSTDHKSSDPSDPISRHPSTGTVSSNLNSHDGYENSTSLPMIDSRKRVQQYQNDMDLMMATDTVHSNEVRMPLVWNDYGASVQPDFFGAFDHNEIQYRAIPGRQTQSSGSVAYSDVAGEASREVWPRTVDDQAGSRLSQYSLHSSLLRVPSNEAFSAHLPCPSHPFFVSPAHEVIPVLPIDASPFFEANYAMTSFGSCSDGSEMDSFSPTHPSPLDARHQQDDTRIRRDSEEAVGFRGFRGFPTCSYESGNQHASFMDDVLVPKKWPTFNVDENSRSWEDQKLMGLDQVQSRMVLGHQPILQSQCLLSPPVDSGEAEDHGHGSPDPEDDCMGRDGQRPGVDDMLQVAQPMELKNSRDEFLVKMRLSGLPYREIKQKGNYSEAESTLRGRFRTLTKEKASRVRKPQWLPEDCRLLSQTVYTLVGQSKAKNAKSPEEIDRLNIQWKEVAKMIHRTGGSYLFGNATCKKKWMEMQGSKKHHGD